MPRETFALGISCRGAANYLCEHTIGQSGIEIGHVAQKDRYRARVLWQRSQPECQRRRQPFFPLPAANQRKTAIGERCQGCRDVIGLRSKNSRYAGYTG